MGADRRFAGWLGFCFALIGPAVAGAAAPMPAAPPPAARPASAAPRALSAAELAALQARLGARTVDAAQTFRVELPGCSGCVFASVSDAEGGGDYLLVPDKGELRVLPRHPDATSWTRLAVQGVLFADLDRDGRTDVIAIAEHATGMGPDGARPFPVVACYRSSPTGLVLDEATSRRATDRGVASLAAAKRLAAEAWRAR